MKLYTKKYEEITIEIDGVEVEFKFYPVHVERILSLRKVSVEVANSVVDMMAMNPENLAGSESRQELSPDGAHVVMAEAKRLPASLNVVEASIIKRKSGISGLMDTLLQPKNHEVICELIIDSLRDQAVTMENLKDADAAIFTELLGGFLRGNRKILDPILGALQSMMPAPQEDQEQTQSKSGRPSDSPS